VCGPTAYSYGDAQNRAKLTSLNDFKTRCLGTSMMHLGISETQTPHRYLQMELVINEIGKFARKNEERVLHHINGEATQLLDNSELLRTLKKTLLS